METKSYVPYYRVSTKKQGNSGLGLEGQQAAVQNYCRDSVILKEFTEVESGSNCKRVELDKAIAFSKAHKATLIVAKLDRLSRNVSFVFKLLDNKVDFYCLDIPECNTLNIGIFATMAQYELENGGKRTSAGIQAKIARGFKWGVKGKFNLTDEARKTSIENRVAAAKENVNNIQVRAIIKRMHKEGKPPTEIANHLNSLHYKTATGLPFKSFNVLYHLTKIKEYRI